MSREIAGRCGGGLSKVYKGGEVAPPITTVLPRVPPALLVAPSFTSKTVLGYSIRGGVNLALMSSVGFTFRGGASVGGAVGGIAKAVG